MSNTLNLSALKVGDQVGVSRCFSSYESINIYTVERFTATLIIAKNPATGNQMKFKRDTGYQVGASSRYSEHSLVSVQYCKELEERRKVKHRRNEMISALKEINWEVFTDEQLHQAVNVYALKLVVA